MRREEKCLAKELLAKELLLKRLLKEKRLAEIKRRAKERKEKNFKDIWGYCGDKFDYLRLKKRTGIENLEPKNLCTVCGYEIIRPEDCVQTGSCICPACESETSEYV